MAQTPSAIIVESPVLQAGRPIPRSYTADGSDVSPPLTWRHVPDGTKQFALVCDDPDAPSAQPFVHWVLYGIPPSATGLPEGVPAGPRAAMPADIAGAAQGTNDFHRPGYRGPAPPRGQAHHYHFTVYALDVALDLPPGLARAQLLHAIERHVIGRGELVATYQRP